MKSQPIIVLITAPNIDSAKEIADVLISRRIAACVNIIPGILSIYTWQGEQTEDEEVLLVVKSVEALFNDQLITAVKKVHPYEVPEIIALPVILGADDYLDWIDEMTGGQ